MVKMTDGRYLMARKADLLAFFDQHHIVGKTITGIFPEDMDYGFSTMDDNEELEYPTSVMFPCSIQTDGIISVELNYGDRLEIAFSGEGPIILNMVPAEKTSSSKIPCDLYSLNTMFHACRQKKIIEIVIDQAGRKMMFPCYSGIDMSAEDEGVWRIRLKLDDETYLAFSGSVDWGQLELLDKNGEAVEIPLSWLKPDGPEAMSAAIDEGNYEKILALLKSGVDYPVIDPLWEWPYLWSLQYTGDYPEDNSIRLQIAEQLLKNGESPIVMSDGEPLLDFVCYKIFNDPLDNEEWEYLRKFMVLLVAYGGHTEYCSPRIIRPFDLDHLSKYRFDIFLEADGYHRSAQIRDEQNNVIAIV